MSEPLLCPDCGGVIGEAESGMKSCACFVEPQVQTMSATRAPDMDDQSEAPVVAPPVVEKICRVCGKNLAGRKRMKDSNGYICVPCAEDDKKAMIDDGLVACGECGRRLKPAGLINYQGTMVCKKCYADHQEMSKFKAPPPNLSQIETHEKESFKSLLIIGGIVLFIVLLAMFGVIGRGWF